MSEVGTEIVQLSGFLCRRCGERLPLGSMLYMIKGKVVGECCRTDADPRYRSREDGWTRMPTFDRNNMRLRPQQLFALVGTEENRVYRRPGRVYYIRDTDTGPRHNDIQVTSGFYDLKNLGLVEWVAEVSPQEQLRHQGAGLRIPTAWAALLDDGRQLLEDYMNLSVLVATASE